ncbi:MAG: acetyl-CoA carboxylase biotin carboxyl carrier protein [Candidatus Bipolaricaulia bacterium]
MDLNINQMKELIDLFENSNLSEISVQQEGFQVTLKKNSEGGSQLRSGKSGSQLTTEKKAGEELEGGADSDAEELEEESAVEVPTITSPIVGTFYRSPSPEEPAYVEVGDRIEEGDTVCIVEAMKVMNEVKAETGGEIAEICVEDGDSVEYGQELFKLVKPEKGS